MSDPHHDRQSLRMNDPAVFLATANEVVESIREELIQLRQRPATDLMPYEHLLTVAALALGNVGGAIMELGKDTHAKAAERLIARAVKLAAIAAELAIQVAIDGGDKGAAHG